MLKSISIFAITLVLTLSANAQLDRIEPDTMMLHSMDSIWEDDKTNVLTFSDTGILLQEESDTIIAIEDDFSRSRERTKRSFSQHGVLLRVYYFIFE